MAVVNATSREDLFDGTGGAGNTSAGDDTIIYSSSNQVDNTLADPATSTPRTQDTIDGGDGFDTIQVGTGGAGVSIDFAKASQVAPITPPALFFNIEALAFTNTSGNSIAKFDAEQFGAGLISSNLRVTGIAGSTQEIDISFFTLAGGTFDASGWTFVDWTSGTDLLTIAGSGGDDTITGSFVADTIDGNTGNDIVNLGNGQFQAGEMINGGADSDTLVITNASVVDFSTGTLNQIESLSGSAGDDTLTMTFGQWGVFTSGIDLGSGANTLNVLASTAGTVGGGAIPIPATLSNIKTGNLVGTSGSEVITISGAQLNAILIGDGTIDLGAGSDALNLTSTAADLNTLGLDDTRISGVETISLAAAAGGGNVSLVGQTEGFVLTGGAGNDTFAAGSGADTIAGAGGADSIAAGDGDDVINLASGNFVAGEFIDGGKGVDVLALIASVTVDLSAGTLAGIEVLTGSSATDTVTLSAAQWTDLQGIDLAAGNNVLNVVASGDVSGKAAPALANIVTGNLRGTTLADSVTLTGSQLDSIILGAGNIDLGNGTDTINITSTSVDLNVLGLANAGIAGVEAISATAASAGVAIAMTGQVEGLALTGSSSADTISGGTGADTINGGGDSDNLSGSGGSDAIGGDAGSDTIVGGTGADTLAGGAGGDLFSFGAGSSILTISGNLTNGAVAGYDIVSDFAIGSISGASDGLSSTGASLAAATSGADGANSVLQLNTSLPVASHRIVNGIVSFDDSNTFSAPVQLQTAGDIAAAVQYLQANNFGAGATLAFTATLAGAAHTFVFIQGDTAGTNSQDQLVDLPNVTAQSLSIAGGRINLHVTPVANADAVNAVEDTPVVYAAAELLGNDSNAIAFSSVTSGTGGTATLNTDGTITFTPDANFNGTATFTYVATEGQITSGAATVTVTVSAVNDSPLAVDDHGIALEAGVGAGADATGNVLGNDTDVDSGDTKTVTTTGDFVGTHGTLTLNADGTYTYVVDNTDPAVDALRTSTDTLTDTFSYTMTDAAGATSTANLLITIEGANDAPAIISSAAVSIAENSKIVASLAAIDPDQQPQPLSYSIVLPDQGNGAGADGAKFAIDAVTGALSFIAAPNFESPADAGANNVYDVTVQVSDGNGGTAQQTVAVTVTNVAGISPAPSNAAAINGTGEEDHLVGLQGANKLAGGGANDTLDGGAGNDTLVGGAGADALIGGAGSDTAAYLTAVRASLATSASNTGEAAGDTYNSIENLTGSGFADALTGDAAANTLNGGGGDDTLDGGGGNDVLIGGAGADSLVGGAGIDTVWYQSAVTASLSAPAGNTGQAVGDSYSGIENLVGSGSADSFTGDAGNNNLNGAAGDDTLDGSAGNDVLVGGAGADSLVGGSGIDAANYQSAVTVSFFNAALNTGDAAGDSYSGIENLGGSGFADNLTGSLGANVVNGGAGNDTITGQAGRDTLVGGAGLDTFVFQFGFGNDIINDFDADPLGGQDLLDVSAMGITAANFASRVTISDLGADTLVTFYGNAALTVKLAGVADAATVTIEDFKLL